MAKRKAGVKPTPRTEEGEGAAEHVAESPPEEVAATVAAEEAKEGKPWVDFCPHCKAKAPMLHDWPPGCRKGHGRRCCRHCGASVPMVQVEGY